MPEFRCDFYDVRRSLSFQADIQSRDLEAAKRHAWEIFRLAVDREPYELGSFEIWQNQKRVWPERSERQC